MSSSKPSTHAPRAKAARSTYSTSHQRPYYRSTHVFWNSNLTFGAGGKDKEGKNVSGWGYYEVYAPLVSPEYTHRLSLFARTDYRRRLRSRSLLARHIRRAHAHHEHAHRGRRDPRTSVPRHDPPVRAARGVRRQRPVQRRRRRSSRNRVYGASPGLHPI